MQTVIHNYDNMSPLFNQIEWLYAYVSDKTAKPLVPHILDESFRELCDTLAEHIPDFDISYIDFINCKFPKISGIAKLEGEDGNLNSNVIVCISGGKDSVALTKLLIETGHKVYLYHMRGINKVYPDEYKAVIDIAKHFNVPYFIDTVVLSGTQRFTEHPMKNMIIANGALHYGIREGIGTKIAFGNFNESYLDGNQFDVCAGDCMDMWYCYEAIIHTIIRTFFVSVPLRNNQETLDIISNNMDLLPLTISCMSPYRFREHWKKRTEKKYGVKLIQNRCGCCWKCAVEYIYYSDRNLLAYDENYYIHCVQILCDTLKKESKVTGTIEQVWEEYMHYPIRKSRAWEVLKDAVIQNGKVKCITAIVK